MSATDRTVVILGGGVGGIVAARRLRHLLPRRDRVVLIDRERQHVFQPSLLWLAAGTRSSHSIQRPLERLRRHGIDVVTAEITRVDPASRTVTAGGKDFTGDGLIVALGAELAPEMIPGLGDAGHSFYTLGGASNARDALRSIVNGRVVVLTAAPAYKCPAAPYEMAMLADGVLRQRGLRERVQVDFYAAEPLPMGVAGPAVSAGVRQLLQSREIGYWPERQVQSVDGDARRIAFADGTVVAYEVLLAVPPHRAPTVLRESGLVGESGWISVDRHTLATSFPMVFAVGDSTSIPLAMGKPLPKAGVFAHAQAEIVAHNLASAWTGRGSPLRFEGEGSCFVETGDGRAGIGSGNFYAEPKPVVSLRGPARWWHWAKVLYEWSWFRRWF